MARFKADALHCLDARHPCRYTVTLQLISSYFGRIGSQVSYELGNYIPYFQLPSSKSQPNCMLANWNWNVRFEVAILVAEFLINHGSQSFYSTRKGNSQQCQRRNWERWLNGTGQRQIARDFIDNFCKRCHSGLGIGGNRIWHARTDDVLTYVEFCKQQQPSITAREIQKKLVHNRICLI